MRGAKKSLRVVVDASVARASGSSSDPLASACRKALQDMLTVCHRVVFSPEIEAEWRRHRSRFFLTWRKAMVARKKQVTIPSAPIESVLDHVEAAPSSSSRKIMTKDAHLVAAAIQADRIVLSCDQAARKHFESLGLTQKQLAVVWLNPANRDECARLAVGPRR